MPYGTSESIDETEADSQTKNRLVVAKEEGRGGGEVDWDFEVSRCKLLSIGWTSNKVLLYSRGN